MLIVIVSMAGFELWVLREDVKRSVIDAQTTLIENVAEDLDDQIAARRDALSVSAAVLANAGITQNVAALEDHWATRPVVAGLFDALFVADASGRIVFDTPHLSARRNISIADRPYFQQVMKTAQPVISDPLPGRATNNPNVVFAAPIRDADGRVVGVLGGILYLNKANFIGALGHKHIGKEGYFALLSKGETPTILMHGHSHRILERIPPAQINPHVNRALQGMEGTVEDVNSVGTEALFSYRTLRNAPWVLAAAYPTKEAYAGLYARQRDVLIASALLVVLSGVLLWWFIRRLLAPLDLLRAAMHADSDADHLAVPVQATDSTELRELVAAYNTLMNNERAYRTAMQASEQRLRSILEHAPDAIISIDERGCIVEWNRQAENTFGWQRAQVLGKDLTSVVVPLRHRAAHAAGAPPFLLGEAGAAINKRFEVEALHRDGHEIPIEMSVAAFWHDQAYIANAFLHDISERKQAQRDQAESQRRLRTVTDNLPMLISYIDKDMRFQFANGMYETWLGIPISQITGRAVREVLGEALYEPRVAHFNRALAGVRVEFEMESNAKGIHRHLHSVYVPHVEEDGSVAGIFTLSTDISAFKAIEMQLVKLARFDTLTTLPNRSSFDEALPASMARCRRSRKAMAVLYLDIDHFKSINDSFGHSGGDQVLVEFAMRLTHSVRATDTVARLAGDEFCIILEALESRETPLFVARKIVAAMADPFDISGTPLRVTTSIGIAIYEGDDTIASALLSRADAALYQAKYKGRNNFHVSPVGSERLT